MIVQLFFQNAADHPFGGPILSARKTRSIDPFAWHAPHIVVDDWRTDWDVTHFVVDGRAEPIPPEVILARELAMARVRLRVRRDAILRDVVDPVRTNPPRWNALTAAQQAALSVYRQALLDWPATELDPLAPTPPPVPEFL
jgi:hypothetical protein